MGNSNSRSTFRETIDKMLTNTASELDENYWIDIFKVPEKAEDIYFEITPAFVKELLNKQPTNLANMLRLATNIIQCVSKQETECERIIVLNSLRIISKLLPILLETEETKNLIYENGLGFEIVDGLMGLLFTHNFSISYQSSVSPYEFDPNRCWNSGFISGEMHYSTILMNENRVEILRAILACCCQTLYTDINNAGTYVNPWAWMITSNEMRYSKELFFSLLNTVFAYPTDRFNAALSDPLGMVEKEASLSSQVLIMLLDSKTPTPQQIQENWELKGIYESLQNLHSELQGFSAELSPLKLENAFATYLSEINDPSHFKFIVECFSEQLNTVVAYNSSYLFSSIAEVPFYQELVVLLWQVIGNNQNFEKYLIKKKKIFGILDSLIFSIWNLKDKSGKVGVAQLCIFILLHFSSEREYSIKVAEPYDGHLNIDIPGAENYYDLIIGIAHNIIINQSYLIEAISTLMIIVLNHSAYVKKISNSSALKLFAIFEHFAAKKFLYKESGNYGYLYQILEVFNHRLQCQWDGSASLIYLLISNKNSFDKLVNMKYEHPSDSSWDINEDWFRKWKNDLPIGLIITLYRDMLPRIEKLCTLNTQTTDIEVIDFLSESTMVGIFPVPHALFFRKFHGTKQILGWLTSLLWGTIYIRGQILPIFDLSAIKLFTVSAGQASN
ncbi:unnamed protein product [Blepharisma stoltei]|uniref:Uncharacterized protein n=1 Tax=Blepharisma stoltei TaxID=1481888 RepID=A0AAU9IZ00_9CILI|nr:unnamed protein product [Blepharisma stoltei]